MKNMPGAVRHDWTLQEIEELYASSLPDLIFSAQQALRAHHDPNKVQMCALLSIKTGGCPENCGYCSQSTHHGSASAGTALMDTEEVLCRAAQAKADGANRLCMGAAWREVQDGPDFERILDIVRRVSAMGLETCCTLGMLTQRQAERLAEAGLDSYNHNLDTSPEYYANIVSTRTYEDRLATLAHVRKAGISVCCGGIIGMGESLRDRLRLLQELSSQTPHPDSVPINMLVRVEGTPLAAAREVDPFELVRMFALTRILIPKAYVRISAGRADLSREVQALCFLAGANSVFSGEKLLTTPNPCSDEDKELFKALKLGRRSEAVKPLGAVLDALKVKGLHRSLPRGFSGLVDLCSNDYLGLSVHPEIRAGMARALESLPLGAAGSRLVRGNHPIFEETEAKFAAFKGTDAALLFSSGYMANIGLLPALAGPEDTIFSDALNHASLIDGMRLSGARKIVYPHLDLAALEDALKKAPGCGRRFIVTESLFSMEGDIAPLGALAGLAQKFSATLIVDEAHAVGIYGEKGSGLLEEQGVRGPVISVNTCGKALGLSGAFICGPKDIIEILVNRCRSFIFSTAMPPHLAAGLQIAVSVAEREKNLRLRLLEFSREARELLQNSGLSIGNSRSQILPVIIGESAAAVRVSEVLRAGGYDLRAIRPPTVPEGTARLRMTITPGLDSRTLKIAVEKLCRAVNEQTSSPQNSDKRRTSRK